MKGSDQKHDTLNPIETLCIMLHKWMTEMHSRANNKSLDVLSTRSQGNTLKPQVNQGTNLLNITTHDQISIIAFNHYFYAKF